MSAFAWLHGASVGHPCVTCGYTMDSREQETIWHSDTRTYTFTDRQVCQPCRAAEASAIYRGSTSPSPRSLSISDAILAAHAAAVGRR